MDSVFYISFILWTNFRKQGLAMGFAQNHWVRDSTCTKMAQILYINTDEHCRVEFATIAYTRLGQLFPVLNKQSII